AIDDRGAVVVAVGRDRTVHRAGEGEVHIRAAARGDQVGAGAVHHIHGGAGAAELARGAAHRDAQRVVALVAAEEVGRAARDGAATANSRDQGQTQEARGPPAARPHVPPGSMSSGTTSVSAAVSSKRTSPPSVPTWL